MLLLQKLKLEALEKSKLPNDVLETLDSKPIKKKKGYKDVKGAPEDPNNVTESLSGTVLFALGSVFSGFFLAHFMMM